MILRCVLAVIVGISVLAWSDVTVLALAIMFAVYAVEDHLRRSTEKYLHRVMARSG